MNDLLGLTARWFGPMLEDSDAVGWADDAFWFGVAVLAVIGLVWIRRSAEPGPLERGEARWRYRDRDRIEGLNRGAATVRLPPRTRGWWATRIEFGAGIGMVVGLPLLLLAQRPSMGDGAIPIAAGGLVSLAGYAGMLFGLWWMVRIYRAGLRNDAKATWRYRDRQS